MKCFFINYKNNIVYMNQKTIKESHQNIPTIIEIKPEIYSPDVTLPPLIQNQKPYLEYENDCKVNFYYKTSTTKTITTTNKIPLNIYHLYSQFDQSTNNNIIYNQNTYNPSETRYSQYNIERKTFPHEGIKDNKTQIKNTPFGEIEQNFNNIDYTDYKERKTNPQINALNLENIYYMNNKDAINENVVNFQNKTNNKNKTNIKEENVYYNNDMYMFENSNMGDQEIHTNDNDNNNYFNIFNNNQQSIKCDENMINNKNVEDLNFKNNTNFNKKINLNLYKDHQNKSSVKKPNIYMNGKIIINNKIKAKRGGNHSRYFSEYNDLNSYNQMTNYINHKEPSDNMKKKVKNNYEPFYNTMPSLKNFNDLSSGLGSETSTIDGIERKSQPIFEISSFEINLNNSKEQDKNKKNNFNIVTTNNIAIFCDNDIKNINNFKHLEIQNIKDNYIEENDGKNNYKNNHVSDDGQNNDQKSISYNNLNINSNNNDKKEKEIDNNIQIINKKEKIEENNKKEKNNKVDKNDRKNRQSQNKVNIGVVFDTYNEKLIKNKNKQSENIENTKNIIKKEENKKKVDIKKIMQEFDIPNNSLYLDDTYPLNNQKIYKKDYMLDYDNYSNINQMDNNYKRDKNYINNNISNINLNINNNFNPNYNNEFNQNPQPQKTIKNIIFKRNSSGGIIGGNQCQTIVPQQPRKKRPVYKIPPSKKRAVSQGRPLTFIHKYYDENFILEEDNEDISDNEMRKKQNNKTNKIFTKITKITKISSESKEKDQDNSQKQNENEKIIINKEKINNKENLNQDNYIENLENLNIEKTYNEMELSHIRLSLERNSNLNFENKNKESNIDNNADIQKYEKEKNDISQYNKNNKDLEMENQNYIIETNEENNINNVDSNSKIKKELNLKNEIQTKDIFENLEIESITGSNISAPRNSDSIIDQKSSFNSNINIENKNNQESKNLEKKEINSPSNENNNLKESIIISSSFIESNDINLKDSLQNNDINFNIEKNINSNNNKDDKEDINKNLNIEEEKKEDSKDKRLSLNIEGYDLDKYFKKEGLIKREAEQEEFSSSLKTIKLEENISKSEIKQEGEEQKENVGNSFNSNNISFDYSQEEDKLISIDEALNGSVHIPENIQDFVNKNSALYKDTNN